MPDERKSPKLFAIWRGEVDLRQPLLEDYFVHPSGDAFEFDAAAI